MASIDHYPNPVQHTLQPTLTSSSVMAVVYDGGVAIATDRLANFGHYRRIEAVTRQYRVNENIIVAFSGDHADFQWLQNVIERQEEEIRTYHSSSRLTAKGLHSYLISLMYYRRSQMKPLWNQLIVVGMQPEPTYDNLVPFIGIVDQRGVGFETKVVATGMGQMILTDLLHRTASGREFKLSRDEALQLLRDAQRIMALRDCGAGLDFNLSTVDSKGTNLMQPEKTETTWDVASIDPHGYGQY